jgi:hypothetical protein
MIAAGWFEPELAGQVKMLRSRVRCTQEVAREAGPVGSLGPFSAADVAGLIGLALGGESVILLGDKAGPAGQGAAAQPVSSSGSEQEHTPPLYRA